MNSIEKNVNIALLIAVLAVVFNIVAVTQGTAESFYSQIELFISHIFS